MPVSIAHAQVVDVPIFIDSGQELTSIRGNTSHDVALGDLNGNGYIDAVVAQGSFGSAQGNVLWLNNGNGLFTESEQIIGGGDSRGIAVGDLDGDGDLDIIIVNAGSAIPNDDEIWLNQGGAQGGTTGDFIHTQNLTNGQSTAVQLGDLNGNGSLDAVIAGSQGLQIWWNDGSGTFSDGPNLPVFNINDLALGDLNGNGRLDIVVVGEGQLFPSQIWWNEWQTVQSFTPGPLLITSGVNSGVALADLDNDGQMDVYLASSEANVVWWNDGSFFPTSTSMGDQNDTHVALGDLNGNGYIDAFVTRRLTGNSANGVWLNNGDRTFRRADDHLGNYTSLRVALADLNGDGKLDAFVANSGPNKVWYNDTVPQDPNGDDLLVRPFNTNGQELEENSTFGVAVGDLIGNRLNDAITVGFDGTRIWINGGGSQPIGRFHEAQDLEDGWSQAVALGDLNGNGNLDAVVIYFGGDSNAIVWLNGEAGNSSAVFRRGQELTGAPSNPEDVALVDVDEDGDLDIVLASPFGSEIWLNGADGDPPGTFRKHHQLLPPATRVTVGDLDGDGHADLVFTGWIKTSIWRNGIEGDPTGVFRHTQEIDLVATDMALGDLDGDGDLDLFLVFHTDEGQNQIWHNGAGDDPQGTFRDSGQRIKNVNSTAIALGDLNGNGHLDAFITTGSTLFESQSNLIWLNNGDGTGNITEQCVGSESSLSVALGDLNDNGALDAFVGNFGSDLIWLNGVGEVCFCIVDWLYWQSSLEQATIVPPQEDAQSYRALRDHILAHSRLGQRYARLYDQHNAEVFSLIMANNELQADALALLQTWQSPIQALATGHGDSTVIGQAHIDALTVFLNTLATAGSPDLSSMIQHELANLPPLETVVGQTMTQARITIGLDRESIYLPHLSH